MADPARPLTEIEREARFELENTVEGFVGGQVVGEKGVVGNLFPKPC